MAERSSGEAGTLGSSTASSSSTSLWSSILASTSKSRDSRSGSTTTGTSGNTAASSKRLVVLGHHDTGKSTLIQALACEPTGSLASKRDKGKGAQKDGGNAKRGTPADNVPDFGLNYQYLDLADDGEEDASKRLSVYSLPSASMKPYSSLLPLALAEDTMANMIVITLSWERPWDFLEDLKGWFESLQRVVDDIASGKEGAYKLRECAESLETCFRNYNETTQGEQTTSTISTFASVASPEDYIPLPQGTLGQNLGLSIIVVCTKSDYINDLARRSHLSEEQIEHVQQVLRTICLNYGAALFYTSHIQPITFTRLRTYILHRLFTDRISFTPEPTTQAKVALGANTVSQTSHNIITASTRYAYPFPYRANVVDRDAIMVPTGWDSWGKIRILRNDFDPQVILAGWQGGTEAVDGEDQQHGKAAYDLFEEWRRFLVDFEASGQPAKPMARIEAQDEQDFLRIHHDILSREAAKQQGGRESMALPRSAGQLNRSDEADSVAQAAARFFGNTAASGLVGPMASTSLNLPSVEKALDTRDSPIQQDNTRNNTAPARRESSRQPVLNGLSSLTGSSSDQPSPPLLSSLSPSGSAAPGQNKVLSDFFQSLLTARSTNSGSPGKPSNRGASTASPSTPRTQAMPESDNK